MSSLWDLTCFSIAHFYKKNIYLIITKIENDLDRGHYNNTQEPQYNATQYNTISDTILFFLGSQMFSQK